MSDSPAEVKNFGRATLPRHATPQHAKPRHTQPRHDLPSPAVFVLPTRWEHVILPRLARASSKG